MPKLNFYIISFSIFIFSFCNKKINQNNETRELKTNQQKEAGYNINKPPIEYKLINMRDKIKSRIKSNYKLEMEIVKGSSGGAILNETLWILNLVKDKKINSNKVGGTLQTVYKILDRLEKVKKHYGNNDIWGVGFKDIYTKFISKKKINNKISIKEKKTELKSFINSLKQDFPKHTEIFEKIYKKYLDIEKIKTNTSKDPSGLFKFKIGLKANFLLVSILKRGILNYNPHWWELTDIFVKDKSGLISYYDAKAEYKRLIASVKFFGKTIHIVADNNCAKQILYFSAGPKKNIFKVGEVKNNLFHSFMHLNVGKSYGSEWLGSRKVNNLALDYNKLHKYSQIYNNQIKDFINEKRKKNELPKKHPEFFNQAKRIVTKIVFGDNVAMPEEIFHMYNKANSITNIMNKNYTIPSKIIDSVRSYFKKNINNPKPNSLVGLAVQYKGHFHCPYLEKSSKKRYQENEIINQIPHWIFPLMTDLFKITPRTLMFICNHPEVKKKLKEELEKIDINDSKAIYKAKLLRACILETLRLNTTTNTILRRLSKDYSFDLAEKYKYKKDDQFLILTNPVNREPEKYNEPNKFKPERWIKEPDLEKSFYAVMFGQGPQDCPGKEIGIFVTASYIAHYLKAFNYNIKATFNDKEIKTDYIKQMYNPGKIKILPFKQKIYQKKHTKKIPTCQQKYQIIC